MRWRGTALGAQASLTILHWDEAEARHLISRALAELARLEAVFSLYRADSALSRLNRDGALSGPPLDLVRLLHTARRWSERTGGAFDVTVQPLWRLYAEHFAVPGTDPDGPPAQAISAARALVDYRALEVETGRIALARPGMAITLNGVAQGYITDRIADLLRTEGLRNILIDLGEIQALGEPRTGQLWRIGLANPRNAGDLLETIKVTDRAVATSAANGTILDPGGRVQHIFNPRSGASGAGYLAATVVARRAADADALSTALLADAGVMARLPEFQGPELDRIVVLSREGTMQSFSADSTAL